MRRPCLLQVHVLAAQWSLVMSDRRSYRGSHSESLHTSSEDKPSSYNVNSYLIFRNDKNVKVVENIISTIKGMKEQQIQNIETGFTSIFQKLEEKKLALIDQFSRKYDWEVNEAKRIEGPVLLHERDLLGIDKTYRGKSSHL